ncbi:sodium/solute symporter [Gilvimarinus agarilyticus]|uniref:sodium:solute symporter family transporter n=1 Tax=Gilvimarinus sp. 2_MG-2023 TaxID=3062666 RepID=UPI001C09C354|nr:sodium/solute symporter [Gilvimarinus sp. 2_MG-2023]MBU2887511.1 sodium/solute symporter [Gilvimarinus agarilyticus]MDO6572162.1 sodium/solute symporter [Gilvimarinus sp. 2_MG-2023]
MLHSIDYFVIAFYVIAIMAVGLFVASKQKKGASLFLGDKSVGFASIGMSIWGTNIGPSFLVASFGAAYGSGMLVANFEWMAWIFLLLLAMVFSPYYLGLNVPTIPQIIKRRFGDTMYRLLTIYSLCTIVVVWLGGGLYVGGLLFTQFMGWDLTLSILFLLVIATSFTVVGGLAAVIVTDAFQTILMIVGMAALTLIGLYELGGVGVLIEKTPASYWTLIDPDSPDVPWYSFLLGFPVMAVWFWCTDQTIVQRVFAAKDLPTAQKGVFLAAALKILPPFIFILPGIIFFCLNPSVANSDQAFIAMVSEYMPIGFRGLMIAVLIAALISTLDSGLNSFSTIFTLDFYQPVIHKGKEVSNKEIRFVGQMVTLAASVLAFFWAVAMGSVSANLFELLQSLIAFLAPPLSTLFLVGLFWRRVTAIGATYGFALSCVLCVTVGFFSVNEKTFGLFEAWPHFLTTTFILFVISVALTVVLSLLTKPSPDEQWLPTFKQMATQNGSNSKPIWIAWGVLALVMVSLYGGFQYLASGDGESSAAPISAQATETTKPQVSVYRGESPNFDGWVNPEEYRDATKLDGIDAWVPQFSPVHDKADLSGHVYIKHDTEYLYFAFDITDDVLYGIDTERWLPDENPRAHELTREGFPWFGDGVEVLINAENKAGEQDGELNKGNGHSWQMVVSTHKSRLGGLQKGGLLEGEERSLKSAWDTYQAWILSGAMQAKVRIKPDLSGYTLEWRIKPNPTLEIAPGVFWSAEMPVTEMGLNLAVGDLDKPKQENWGGFHHENWWSGERDKRTWLKHWGTMRLYGDYRSEYNP